MVHVAFSNFNHFGAELKLVGLQYFHRFQSIAAQTKRQKFQLRYTPRFVNMGAPYIPALKGEALRRAG
nr:MAG TPA: hypothetical protein [Caudoviricetes sp.]